MKNVLVLFIVALVAVVGFGAEVPTVLTGTDTPPDVLPAPAPYGDDAVVFDELLHELSITIDKFKTLYDSRKAMIDLLLSYEHGSAERDEARITLRKMTGELKNIAEEINMITYQMSLLRDKKHEAKQEAKAEEAT